MGTAHIGKKLRRTVAASLLGLLTVVAMGVLAVAATGQTVGVVELWLAGVLWVVLTAVWWIVLSRRRRRAQDDISSQSQ